MATVESKSKAATESTPSGFFVLRTPLMPFDEFLRWSEGLEAPAAIQDAGRLAEVVRADRARLVAKLREMAARPEVRDAIFIASPSLDERLSGWLQHREEGSAEKVELAVARYFSRLAGRATPFGLFAGSSTGLRGETTAIRLAPRERYERHSRLDMDYLFALTEALGRDPAIRRVLTYRPNSSLYEAAGSLHYAEARLENAWRTHHLVAVEITDYLKATLQRAQEGASIGALASALVDSDQEIEPADAEQYVDELIDAQILLSELQPPITGPEAIHALIAELDSHPETHEIAEQLRQVQEQLAVLDSHGLGGELSRYHDVAAVLRRLPAKAELARLFQVDMTKPVVEASLSQDVLAELARGAELLHHIMTPRRYDRFASFRQAFLDRYGEREVPLTEVLDEEIGIGFERSDAPGAEASPLLAGLTFPVTSLDERAPWGIRGAFFLGKLKEAWANGALEITLTEEDVKQLAPDEVPPLPDAFAVMACLAASSKEALAQGKFRVLLKSISGPSGVTLLGRFCHGDEALCKHVREHLGAEEALDSDAVFAEIVHLPEGRIGNILARPVLRGYEIPFLGRSGAPVDRQIPIGDLAVSVSGGRVILRSTSLQAEVLPRLTSAHNYTMRSLGVYRFLCALQQQGVMGNLMWNWGPFETARFLPRVVSGRLVLSRARWFIDRPELVRLSRADLAEQFKMVQDWRAARRLPRFVALADGDNELLIDLENVLSIEMFGGLVKNRPVVTLVEMFPGPDELCVQGPEGRFTNEVIVPFGRSRGAAPRRPPRRLPTHVDRQDQRSFALGSEWLFAKLYTGTATADRILREVIGPFAHEMLGAGLADQWFFIRYGDPQWHLRVRFHGVPQALRTEVLPALEDRIEPLRHQGLVARIQFDVYEREVERYGGIEGMRLAEQLFCADSEAVLTILDAFIGDVGLDARWRLALLGADRILTDVGCDLAAKREAMAQIRTAFGREFRADSTGLKHQLGDKFRGERKALEALLTAASDGNASTEPGLMALNRRSEELRSVVDRLRECEQAGRLTSPLTELAHSYIHMHVNRLLRSAHRAQELVLYDFLLRLYESRIARNK